MFQKFSKNVKLLHLPENDLYLNSSW